MRWNCRTVFDLIAVLDLEFWRQMTGWLEIWVGKERWATDSGSGFCLLTIRFEHHKCEDKDSQKVY